MSKIYTLKDYIFWGAVFGGIYSFAITHEKLGFDTRSALMVFEGSIQGIIIGLILYFVQKKKKSKSKESS